MAYSDFSAGGHFISGYVGSTDDPAGAGTLLAKEGGNSLESSITFAVPNGKYFEVTVDSQALDGGITWQPTHWAGDAPADQD